MIEVKDRTLEAMLPKPECTCFVATTPPTVHDAKRASVRVRNPLCEVHKDDNTVLEKMP